MRDNPCCPGSAYAIERRVFVTYRPEEDVIEVLPEDLDYAQEIEGSLAICCGCGGPIKELD